MLNKEMRMSKKIFVWMPSVLAALTLVLACARAQDKPGSSVPPPPPVPPVFLNASDLVWADAPPALPPGAKVAVVHGEPLKGPYSQFVKVPNGYVFPPHRHEQNEWVTLISGTVVAGFGEKINEDSGAVLTAGGYGYLPAGTPHWAVAKTDVFFYQHVGGAASIAYLNPADDPRSKPR
jgi:quercetin dioxygenase-like cupin family protein